MNNDSGTKPNIMIVGTNKTNCQLLGKFLEGNNFEAFTSCSLEELESAISQKSDYISLALIDITGFDGRIWEQCESLRRKNVPFMIFSPFPSPRISQDGIHSGARAVLIKPLIMKELLFYIQNFLKDDPE